MPSRLIVLFAALLVACGSRPIERVAHSCLDPNDGSFSALPEPTTVVAAGLTYATHLDETGQARAEAPPIFAKHFSRTTRTVAVPTAQAQRDAMNALEPGLAAAVQDRDVTIRPLVDYEVELGLVVRRAYRPGGVPELGFFVANDLSERALQVLGEGQGNRMAYWTASKSFDGFLPTSGRMWQPREPARDALPCVRLTTHVNGELRQDQRTDDLAYTVTELLDAAAASRGGSLPAGAWVLTGTPGGVALSAPWWKVAAANLLGLDRFSRLSAVLGGDGFLAVGDEVRAAGGWLGDVRIELVDASPE